MWMVVRWCHGTRALGTQPIMEFLAVADNYSLEARVPLHKWHNKSPGAIARDGTSLDGRIDPQHKVDLGRSG